MASFYGIEASTASSFFSSMYGINTNSRQNLTGFAALTNSLGEYSSIRNGSYKKIATAYCNKILSSEDSSSDNDNVNNISNDNNQYNTKYLKNLKSSSEGLKEAANEIRRKDTLSVFTKVKEDSDDKDKDSSKDKKYDTNKITNAIDVFVDAYNSTLKDTANVKNSNVRKRVSMMVSGTKAYKSMLKDIGINIKSDNTLEIDKEKLSKANMDKVKSLFQGNNSFASKVEKYANEINKSTISSMSQGSYNQNGSYNINTMLGSTISRTI